MEPRAAQPGKRLEAIAALASAGVPVAVLIGPVIPGLNDAEIPRILAAAAKAGATSASWVLLRLPRPIDALFIRWLEDHLPERRDRVLHRIEDTRDGRISDSAFGRRKRGQGEYAAQIAALFAAAARKHGLDTPAAAAQRGRVSPAAGGAAISCACCSTPRLTAARRPVLKTAMRCVSRVLVLVALVVGSCGMRKEEQHVRTVESNLAAAGFRTILRRHGGQARRAEEPALAPAHRDGAERQALLLVCRLRRLRLRVRGRREGVSPVRRDGPAA